MNKSTLYHTKIDYFTVTPLAEQKLKDALEKAFKNPRFSLTPSSNNNCQGSVSSNTPSSSNAEDLVGIRLGIPLKGCGGLSYQLDFAYTNTITELDEVLELGNGVCIFVDPLRSFMMFGMELDYQEGTLEYGFKFNNPNESGRCGCRSSFYIS